MNNHPEIHSPDLEPVKRPGRQRGRLRGVKDSYKRASLHEKAHAKAMYLAGYYPDDIAKYLNLNSSEVITNWARKEGWMPERDEVLKKTTADRLQELLKQQEDRVSELGVIRDKAFAPIKDDSLSPTKFIEASSAYLSALEMERKIKVEALQISFVSDVAEIIKSKIHDQNLLVEIAHEFRKLFERYHQPPQTSQLPVGRKEQDNIESSES